MKNFSLCFGFVKQENNKAGIKNSWIVEYQNHWEVPDKMTKHTKKYFEKYVSDKELKNNITLNSPEPTNLPKPKTMDDYFVELEESEKEKKIELGDTLKKLQTKILTIMGPLSKVWRSH